MATIVTQIEHIEGRIQKCEDRLDDISQILRCRKNLAATEREELVSEELQLQQAINEHKKKLVTLRSENRRTMLVSVLLLGFIYAIFYFAWR